MVCTHEDCKNKTSEFKLYCNRHCKELFGAYVKKSGIRNAGQGLWAVKEFKRNQRIAQYGFDHIKITEKAFERKFKKEKDREYLICDAGTCWDARAKDSTIARFANDARNPDKNNAEFRILRGVPWIVATKTIGVGMEIFVNYGEEYW